MATIDCADTLKELNRQAFSGEERETIATEAWDEFLRRVLADKFAIAGARRT